MYDVLLVDDDPRILDVTTRFLEQGGDMQVTTAQSGEEALGILGRQQFDAIVADYLMEGCDGIAVLKAVREGKCATGADTVFIILTGKSTQRTAIDALNYGADAYLRKGKKTEDLFGSLRDTIRAGILRHGRPAGAVSRDTPGGSSGATTDAADDPLVQRYAGSKQGVIIASCAGRILFMNQTVVALLGLPESGEGRQLTELIPDAAGDLALINRISSGLISTYRLPRGAQKPQATTRLSRATFRQEDAVIFELRV